ncbi:hypothetical protein B0J12DRAFT_695723 [Macrophomina phaseolina]|uniref:Uncharacterized protein n=1 Tax=Macrophomina phaseolina TaxID=35725 RepID=A0ABQ8GQ14_9PEZI|nr:hypothetical protein B0J12DRAFT_695723 [Macrophomina phaseolina]
MRKKGGGLLAGGCLIRPGLMVVHCETPLEKPLNLPARLSADSPCSPAPRFSKCGGKSSMLSPDSVPVLSSWSVPALLGHASGHPALAGLCTSSAREQIMARNNQDAYKDKPFAV